MENELLKLILQELRELKEETNETKKTVTRLEEKVNVNTENIEAIKSIVMEHYKEFKNYVRQNSVQHKLYDSRLLRLEEESEGYNENK